MIDVEAFALKARAWLAEHAAAFSVEGPPGTAPDPATSRAFRSALWDAGLLGITLDPAYGGQGLTEEHQKAFAREASAYRLPPIGEPVTTGICAPTLLDFGSEEQKKRHVPRMIRGEETWTQLLSEPGAGSDLAGLQTKAVRDGDVYVIDGQKVWTSGARQSDFALCVARTNPDVPKHQGLSMFIVDLKAPGITIRPLRQMNGQAHFNEVFLDGVRVPAENLVGRENDGWRALTAMLTHERLALGAGTGAGGSGESWSRPASSRFVELARARGLAGDPVVRQELVKLYVAEKVLAYMGQKMRDEIAAGVPVGSKGSVAKLATAILARQSASLGMALGGPGSQAWLPGRDGDLAAALLTSPMMAIAGGTSEIQRNTIGERVLGLPREPQVDRDVPFREILQNPRR
ncbi:MAG TPA: acyl-CoA dehydrogenase family protein [Acidimicrobiales bacterium]|nr:acyl-CoA dehydrogenase family protein [Acidimicrobiales bacterium]